VQQILVIDDDVELCELVAEYLERKDTKLKQSTKTSRRCACAFWRVPTSVGSYAGEEPD